MGMLAKIIYKIDGTGAMRKCLGMFSPHTFRDLVTKLNPGPGATRSNYENIEEVRLDVNLLARQIYEEHGLLEPPEHVRGDVPDVIAYHIAKLREIYPNKLYEIV